MCAAISRSLLPSCDRRYYHKKVFSPTNLVQERQNRE
jgi:hypothetical protein